MNNDLYLTTICGTKIPLTKIENVGFITPKRGENLIHIAARLAGSTRLCIDNAYAGEKLVVLGDAKKLEEIKKNKKNYEYIENVRSAFHDPTGKVLILTNEILIRFIEDSNDEERNKMVSKFGGRVILKNADYWKINVTSPDDDAPIKTAMELSSEKIVKYAEPNAIQKATFHQLLPQNEPRFENQWYLNNIGQNGGTAGADVKAIDAWKITKGSPNIAIAVIDSGVDTNHPDLKTNINPGWDFDYSDSDPTNFDNPHGTACAGIIAAPVNGKGITGIAPGCRIIPIKSVRGHSWEAWAKIFDWAVEQGSKIISCSWSITENSTVSLAIQRAVEKGVVVFCSTGNNRASNEIAFPACMDETIAVGACTNRNVLSDYSQTGSGLDVVAPSSGGTMAIDTTDVAGNYGYNRTSSPDGDYCDAKGLSGFGGTSAANALTAGIAGLMLSINPALSPGNIRDILRKTADKIDKKHAAYDSKGWSLMYGYGKVNAAAAVNMVKSLKAKRRVSR